MIVQPLVIPTLAAVASLVALVTILRRRGRDSVSFPGPPRHWLLGNALSMPKTKEWLTFAEWEDYTVRTLTTTGLSGSIITAHHHIRAYCLVESIWANVHPSKHSRESKRNHGEAIRYQF